MAACNREDTYFEGDPVRPFEYEVENIQLTTVSGKNEVDTKEGRIPQEGIEFSIIPKRDFSYATSAWDNYQVEISVDHGPYERSQNWIDEFNSASERGEPIVAFSGDWGTIVRETYFPFATIVNITRNSSHEDRFFKLSLEAVPLQCSILSLTQPGEKPQ